MKAIVRLFSLLIGGLAIFVANATAHVLGPNAVSYINVGLVAGFNLLTNPLLNGDQPHKVSDIVRAVQGTVPDGMAIFLLGTNGYRSAVYDVSTSAFEPAEFADEAISPGSGFFLYLPGSNRLTLTFAGTIMQGTLTNEIPAGFSIVGSMVPQEGTLELLKFPVERGDIVFRFDPVLQRFISATFDDLESAWVPVVPRLQAAEGFIVFKHRPAVWTRTFFLNP
jgi:hypothetical protein